MFDLLKRIKKRFPGCFVLKNDPNYLQGVPDFQISVGPKVAWLEFKKSEDATHQPNQDYYVEKMNSMSFSAFIFPENKEKVLDDLERSFKGHPKRRTRTVSS